MISICVPNSYKNTPLFLKPIIKVIDKRVGHLRHYDPKDLIKKFEKHGMKLMDLTYHGHSIIVLNSLLNMIWKNPPGVLDKLWWWITEKDIDDKKNSSSVNFTITMQKIRG